MLVDKDVYLAYKVDEFLEHYGVPGMRWGIRHPRSYTSEIGQKIKALTKFNGLQEKKHGGSFHLTEKEKIAGIGVFVGVAALGIGIATHKGPSLSATEKLAEQLTKERAALKPGEKISRALSKKLFDESVVNRIGSEKNIIYGLEHQKGFTVPKYESFNRMSFDAEKGMGKRPVTWVTYGEADRNRYTSLFGSSELGVSKEIRIKSNADIKFPGTEDVVHAMQESIGKDGKLSSRDEALTAINGMTTSGYDNPTATALIKTLRSKGYGGMIDYLDAGMIGERPLVLFNTEAVGTYTSRDLTPEDWKVASNNLVAMNNMRWLS